MSILKSLLIVAFGSLYLVSKWTREQERADAVKCVNAGAALVFLTPDNYDDTDELISIFEKCAEEYADE